jgi:hypothetical protein
VKVAAQILVLELEEVQVLYQTPRKISSEWFRSPQSRDMVAVGKSDRRIARRGSKSCGEEEGEDG